MDVRAMLAAQHHHRAGVAKDEATEHRRERDKLVRELRIENKKYWTYPQLAKAVGCSEELIAQIVKAEARE